MNPADLERLIGDELKKLPAPRAPRTLLPRVLAATVERKPEPWYARPWLSWPLAWQVTSAAAMAAVLAVAAFLGVPALSWLSADSGAAGSVAGAAETLRQVSALVRVSWRLLLEPVAFAVMVLAVTLSLGCAAFWALLEVALGGASES